MHCSHEHVKNGMFSFKSNKNFQLLGELIWGVDTDNSTPKFWATFWADSLCEVAMYFFENLNQT
jgi:hypothetical protein